MKNKDVLIVFPDEWLSYSPTIINLAHCFMQKGDNVEIIAMRNGNYSNENIKGLNISYIDTNNYINELFNNICSYKTYKLFLLIMNLVKIRKKYDIVIGIDSLGYLACKITRKKTIYLSLEVVKDKYFDICSFLGIDKMIIQSKERMEYLLENKKVQYFKLPNSPIYTDINIDTNICTKKRIVYFGNVCRAHGIYDCIDALKYLDDNFSLELHGIISLNVHKDIFSKYKKYIKEGRLILSKKYIPENDIINYLSHYYIGLCFYDFTLIGKNDFNYISCPSGKLYNYYAAELPVVGNDILGLRSCKKYNCGRLLKEVNGLNIAKAILSIEKEYMNIKNNCKIAAKENDFYKYFDDIYVNL